MTPQEFFYWLQGFFELGGIAGPIYIDARVAACVLAHIDLIGERARGEGVIEVRTLTRLAANAKTSEETQRYTDAIAAAVANVFTHVIDPLAGDAAVQARLNALHRPGDHRPVARC